MGTLPATRSQQGCWEIGAGAGSQMGTAGSQNSGGSQQGCWEPTGNDLGAKTPVVPSKAAGNQLGDGEIWPAAGVKICSVLKTTIYVFRSFSPPQARIFR